MYLVKYCVFIWTDLRNTNQRKLSFAAEAEEGLQVPGPCSLYSNHQPGHHRILALYGQLHQISKRVYVTHHYRLYAANYRSWGSFSLGLRMILLTALLQHPYKCWKSQNRKVMPAACERWGSWPLGTAWWQVRSMGYVVAVIMSRG